MPGIYTMSAFDKLFRRTPLDDLGKLVGLHVVWSDGERVQVRMVNGKIVVPASIPCARCGALSDEKYLVAHGAAGWTLILNEQGETIADMDTQAYVCDESVDEGGLFVDEDEVGQISMLAGLMGMARMFGTNYISHTSDVNDDSVLHVENIFGGKKPPGWSGGNGLN